MDAFALLDSLRDDEPRNATSRRHASQAPSFSIPRVKDPSRSSSGREDKGLPNEILDRAHLVVTIPTTDHASLNLAQAVLHRSLRAPPLGRRCNANARSSTQGCAAGDGRGVRAAVRGRGARSLRNRILQDAISRAHHALGAHSVLSNCARFAGARTSTRDFHRGDSNNRPHP